MGSIKGVNILELLLQQKSYHHLKSSWYGTFKTKKGHIYRPEVGDPS